MNPKTPAPHRVGKVNTNLLVVVQSECFLLAVVQSEMAVLAPLVEKSFSMYIENGSDYAG